MKSNYDIMLISNLIEGQVLFAYSEGVMPLFLAAENERNRDKSVPQLTLTQKFSKFFSSINTSVKRFFGRAAREETKQEKTPEEMFDEEWDKFIEDYKCNAQLRSFKWDLQYTLQKQFRENSKFT